MDKKNKTRKVKCRHNRDQQAQQRPAATGSEEKGDELLLLTSNSRNIERCDKWSVWLSMQRGFNLNMRATNSPVTAGLRPVTVWIHSDLGQIKRPERYCRGERCLSGRVLWGTMTFLSRDDVTSLSQAFCATVCVFALLVKVRPEGRATPQINAVAITGSVTNTLNWHNHFCQNGLAELKEDHLHRGFY